MVGAEGEVAAEVAAAECEDLRAKRRSPVRVDGTGGFFAEVSGEPRSAAEKRNKALRA